MSVNNFGPEDLHLRLLFEDFPAAPMMPPDNLALSANAVIVPAGSGWMTILLPVSAADLVGGGLGTVLGALMDVDTIRIFHNPAPEFPGPGVGIPVVNATLGVDDIQAVPEPGAIWLLGGGLMAVAGLAASETAFSSPTGGPERKGKPELLQVAAGQIVLTICALGGSL